MSDWTADRVTAELAGVLRNFQDREYSGPIGRETMFFGDLGFASIDAVVLGETLETHFGRKFAFDKFLQGLAKSGAQDIRLGELADFLSAQLQNVQPR